ncbi:D-alanyl-D-alanine carboxypeptidase/D-alanyl-D-alanine endopeptidase [Propionibacteriaceae bacterium Y1685]
MTQPPQPPSADTQRTGSAPGLQRLLVVLLGVLLTIGLQAGATPRAVAAPAAADAGLKAALDEVLSDPAVTNGTTTVQVRDAETGELLYDRDGEKPMKPASNMKLFTAAAAADRLGTDFRFHTDVLATADGHRGTLDGDLILKGYGDPTSLVDDYRDLAVQVRERGVREVTGDLVVDSSYFDDQRINPEWNPGDLSEYYSAQISALTIGPNADYDSGTVIVEYAPGEVGKPAKISVSPAEAASYVDIVNETTTVAAGEDDEFSYSRDNGTNTIRVGGTVAADGGGREWVTVDRPDLLAGSVFRQVLADEGVTISGDTTSGTAPARTRRLARDESMPLKELLVPFMKLSNNMHAEHLTKTLGARATGQPGSWENGTAALVDFVASRGIDDAGFDPADGSGLAHADRISSATITEALIDFRDEPWFDAYDNSLPVAGNPDRFVGGSLRNRMVNTPAANNLRGKTGSLNGVTALSGHVTGADGREYVFSMLSQYEGTSPRSVEDKLGVTLAGWKG